jgi:hypothetical protein
MAAAPHRRRPRTRNLRNWDTPGSPRRYRPRGGIDQPVPPQLRRNRTAPLQVEHNSFTVRRAAGAEVSSPDPPQVEQVCWPLPPQLEQVTWPTPPHTGSPDHSPRNRGRRHSRCRRRRRRAHCRCRATGAGIEAQTTACGTDELLESPAATVGQMSQNRNATSAAWAFH